MLTGEVSYLSNHGARSTGSNLGTIQVSTQDTKLHMLQISRLLLPDVRLPADIFRRRVHGNAAHPRGPFMLQLLVTACNERPPGCADELRYLGRQLFHLGVGEACEDDLWDSAWYLAESEGLKSAPGIHSTNNADTEACGISRPQLPSKTRFTPYRAASSDSPLMPRNS